MAWVIRSCLFPVTNLKENTSYFYESEIMCKNEKDLGIDLILENEKTKKTYSKPKNTFFWIPFGEIFFDNTKNTQMKIVYCNKQLENFKKNYVEKVYKIYEHYLTDSFARVIKPDCKNIMQNISDAQNIKCVFLNETLNLYNIALEIQVGLEHVDILLCQCLWQSKNNKKPNFYHNFQRFLTKKNCMKFIYMNNELMSEDTTFQSLDSFIKRKVVLI